MVVNLKRWNEASAHRDCFLKDRWLEANAVTPRGVTAYKPELLVSRQRCALSAEMIRFRLEQVPVLNVRIRARHQEGRGYNEARHKAKTSGRALNIAFRWRA